jgi:hypothetical protein
MRAVAVKSTDRMKHVAARLFTLPWRGSVAAAGGGVG